MSTRPTVAVLGSGEMATTCVRRGIGVGEGFRLGEGLGFGAGVGEGLGFGEEPLGLGAPGAVEVGLGPGAPGAVELGGGASPAVGVLDVLLDASPDRD